MRRQLFRSLSLVAVIAVSCATANDAEDKEKAGATRSGAEISYNSPIDRSVLEQIALKYQTWGLVDDGNRWAPTRCASTPGTVRATKTEEDTVHGGKLYFLYAKDWRSYVHWVRKPQPIGQVIVKESFHAVEVKAGETVKRDVLFGAERIRLAEKDGKRWKPGEPYALFVMVRSAETEPGTDRGWRYATMSFDGKTIYTNGRVDSCIRCHEEAPHDRLFGLGFIPEIHPIYVELDKAEAEKR